MTVFSMYYIKTPRLFSIIKRTTLGVKCFGLF